MLSEKELDEPLNFNLTDMQITYLTRKFSADFCQMQQELAESKKSPEEIEATRQEYVHSRIYALDNSLSSENLKMFHAEMTFCVSGFVELDDDADIPEDEDGEYDYEELEMYYCEGSADFDSGDITVSDDEYVEADDDGIYGFSEGSFSCDVAALNEEDAKIFAEMCLHFADFGDYELAEDRDELEIEISPADKGRRKPEKESER